MQDNEMDTGLRLCVVAEAVRLVKEAYLKTKDNRFATAALVLAELALEEFDAIDERRRGQSDE